MRGGEVGGREDRPREFPPSWEEREVMRRGMGWMERAHWIPGMGRMVGMVADQRV